MLTALLRICVSTGLLLALASCADEPVPPPPFMYDSRMHNCYPVVLFGSGSATMTHPTMLTDALDGGCPAWRKRTPEISFIVRRHTDGVGSAEGNMALSLKRAEAVRDYLVTLGVPRESIDIAGYGSTTPLVNTKGAERQNRRAVVSLVLNGREIHFGDH